MLWLNEMHITLAGPPTRDVWHHEPAGHDVLPVTWSDNFLTMLSGASNMVVLEYEGGMMVSTVTASAFNA